ncbi:MAG TPA: hypothetical protein VKB95_03275, partial [Chitinophagaceae bacterium]|nr:hypothetical protein [Chitinophagaceae bacterium]
MNTSIVWKEKNIIRLDDHQIVLNGLTQWCLRENPEISIRNYKTSDEVFLLIIESLISGKKIDLFITDFAHSGLNGYDMCKAIRALERALNKPPMLIMLLTLYGSKERFIKDGLEEGVFTRYLSLQ